MNKVFAVIVFMVSGLVVAKESDKEIIYQCPWPDPEFSILTVRPTNLVRIIARPRYAESKYIIHYVDVPFDWVELDQENNECLNLKKFGSHDLQVDWTDSQKRPMRYTYRYLYLCTYGLLLPGSDGKPLPLETSVTMQSLVNPISGLQGTFVLAYDEARAKKLYTSHLLVPTRTLDEPKLDEIPFIAEYPRMEVSKDKKISCVYPGKLKKGITKVADREVVFSATLPEYIAEKHVKIEKNIRAKFSA